MTVRAVIDTHALIWYIFGDERLSANARSFVDLAGTSGDQIAISAMSFAETVYLMERGRIALTTLDQILDLLDQANSVFVEMRFDRRVARAMSLIDRASIPELPDRIIAATAVHLGVPLISRDHKIQSSGVATIW